MFEVIMKYLFFLLCCLFAGCGATGPDYEYYIKVINPYASDAEVFASPLGSESYDREFVIKAGSNKKIEMHPGDCYIAINSGYGDYNSRIHVYNFYLTSEQKNLDFTIP